MFKKTNPNPQMDMFSSPVMLLNVRASKKYSDPKEWHNQFYRFYTSKVDESLFKVLFPEGKKSGRPTASIRVIVCMSWLKEGFGCSDEELFEKCEFDLLTRKALGLELISDAPPSLDTYYLFRRRLCDYAALTGVDLMKKCFEHFGEVSQERGHILRQAGVGSPGRSLPRRGLLKDRVPQRLRKVAGQVVADWLFHP